MKSVTTKLVGELLTKKKRNILDFLSNHGESSIRRISQALSIPHSTTTEQLRFLEDKGFLSSRRYKKVKAYSLKKRFKQENSDFEAMYLDFHKRISDILTDGSKLHWVHCPQSHDDYLAKFEGYFFSTLNKVKLNKKTILYFYTTNSELKKLYSFFSDNFLTERKDRIVYFREIALESSLIDMDIYLLDDYIFIINNKEKKFFSINNRYLSKVVLASFENSMKESKRLII